MKQRVHAEKLIVAHSNSSPLLEPEGSFLCSLEARHRTLSWATWMQCAPCPTAHARCVPSVEPPRLQLTAYTRREETKCTPQSDGTPWMGPTLRSVTKVAADLLEQLGVSLPVYVPTMHRYTCFYRFLSVKSMWDFFFLTFCDNSLCRWRRFFSCVRYLASNGWAVLNWRDCWGHTKYAHRSFAQKLFGSSIWNVKKEIWRKN
jgi:hypothetical protein